MKIENFILVIEVIAFIILFGSVMGMGVIIFQKIPVLAELKPQIRIKRHVFSVLKEKVKSNRFVKGFSFDLFLHKLLSKFRILTLKTENKTSDWLKELRQRAIEKKRKFKEDYWKKLRIKK